MNTTRTLSVASVALLVAFTGACSNNKTTTAGVSAAEQQYEAKLKALREREAALAAKERELASRPAPAPAPAPAAPAPAPAPVQMAADGTLLPPNAKPGQCYARIWIPPVYKTISEKVLKRDRGERLEIIPAKYGYVTEKVLVKEESEKLIPVPATYRTVTEKVLVKEPETFWTFGTGFDGRNVGSAKGPNAKRADANRLRLAREAGLPETAAVGECFAEYYKPAKYATKTEKKLKSEASQKVQVIPAKYGTVTEKVLVQEASTKVVKVPAVYKTVTEKVLVEPARTEWKVSECSGGACQPGGGYTRVPGARDRIDQATGEIMCLVTIPAKYRTITKRIMVTPPTTKTIEIPAKYKTVTVRKMIQPPQEKVISIPETYQTVTHTVKVQDAQTSWHKVGDPAAASAGRPTGEVFCVAATPAKYRTVTRRVEVTPASTKKVVIPAVYKTVKIRKMIQPPQEKRISIPEEYQTVTRREKVSDGHMEWRPVLCQVNMTSAKIREIQKALKAKGYYHGPIDGIVGSQTINAMRKFQKAKGLASTRFLTVETVTALGVSPN